ncbi:hypothetical protein B0F90DRAFT_1755644, partial [Multifurca ochricompacta]
REMRSPDPTLPSITFVLSQSQLAGSRSHSSSHSVTRNRNGNGNGNSSRSSGDGGGGITAGHLRRGWNKLGIRRTKSSPSFSPHPPRYPPRLDSDFLKTVDYRFSNPPRAPTRSSFALPKDIFDADAEIEIVVPSPTKPVTRPRPQIQPPRPQSQSQQPPPPSATAYYSALLTPITSSSSSSSTTSSTTRTTSISQSAGAGYESRTRTRTRTRVRVLNQAHGIDVSAGTTRQRVRAVTVLMQVSASLFFPTHTHIRIPGTWGKKKS